MKHGFSLLASVLVSGASCFAQSLVFNEPAPQFGPTAIGKPTEPKVFSIRNIAKVPVFITGIRVSAEYEENSECPEWLPEESSCLIFVTFNPTSIGPRSGALTVELSNGEQASIPVSGFGLDSQGNSEGPPHQAQLPKRTTNDEELAQSIVNDKQCSFQDLLNKKPECVANAKKAFALTLDTQSKERIASILLSIGVGDRTHTDYLQGEAKKALAHDHDMPWPLLYGEDKKPHSENPALVESCAKAGLPFWDMYRVSYYEIPSAWYYLAAAGHRGSYDLLIQGLHSLNLMIVAHSARGLAGTRSRQNRRRSSDQRSSRCRAPSNRRGTWRHYPGAHLLSRCQGPSSSGRTNSKTTKRNAAFISGRKEAVRYARHVPMVSTASYNVIPDRF